jgi:hypothetical protein
VPIKRRNLADERGAKLARLTIIMAFEIAKLCMIPVKHHFLPMRLAVTELICVLRTASEKDAIPDDLSIAITNALMGRGPMTDFAKKNAVDIPLACFVSKTYNSA